MTTPPEQPILTEAVSARTIPPRAANGGSSSDRCGRKRRDMNRKRTTVLVGCLALLALVGGGFVWSLKYQPIFYSSALATSAPPELRREQADEFVRTTVQLINEIRNDESWSQEFSEEAVNGWLAEELPVKYGELLPSEIAAPRIKFEEGTLLLAFQVRHGMWNGVVSGRVRPWVSGPNQLALEIHSVRIGLIPIPIEEMLGDFVNHMNSNGWSLRWRSSGKQDVLVVDLDDNLSPGAHDERPVLESVDLEPNLLRISGRRSSETADNPRIADKPQ